jgi:hypothetical protein
MLPSVLAADDNDLTSINQEINISEPVLGNVYLLGQSIAVEAPVSRALSAVGQYVLVDAPISGETRIVGQHIRINAPLNDQSTVFGQYITFLESAKIYPGTEIGGQHVFLQGTINGPVVIGAKYLVINTTINGSARVDAAHILFGENASITGDLTLMQKTPVDKALVGGLVTVAEPRLAEKVSGTYSFSFPFEAFFIFLVIALLVVVISHSHVIKLNDAVEKQPFLCLGLGILALVALPLVILFLTITIVGIPLAITLTLAYLLMILFGLVYSIIFVGTILFKTDQKQPTPHVLVAVILGAIIYFTVGELPILGNLVRFVILAVSVGALLRVLFTDHAHKLTMDTTSGKDANRRKTTNASKQTGTKKVSSQNTNKKTSAGKAAKKKSATSKK